MREEGLEFFFSFFFPCIYSALRLIEPSAITTLYWLGLRVAHGINAIHKRDSPAYETGCYFPQHANPSLFSYRHFISLHVKAIHV